jgi:AcrR family transcriptional regulator
MVYHIMRVTAELSDLLDQRRPRRADARRNYDAILRAAADAFSGVGADVSMEEIAGRAGVGVATVYRHFESRTALAEAVYLVAVEELVASADEVADAEPWSALQTWLGGFVRYMATKHPMLSMLSETSAIYEPTRDAIYGVAEPLVAGAQRLGKLRVDIDADDLMRIIFAITGGIYRDPAQLDRAVQVVIDGIAVVAMPDEGRIG